MATIFSLPPELLFNIFAMFNSPPPSRGYIGEDYKRYLERNRNLTSFTLVHSTWRYRATEVLQEEVYLYGSTERVASKEEVQRIASLLIDSKVQGTKYLTVDGHLNELLAATGYTMWSQLRFLKLWTSSRNDHTTWMSDFAHFPYLQELHLEELIQLQTTLKFDTSDIHLEFPKLRRISFGLDIVFGGLSGRSHKEDLTALVPITHKLFSPSNIPNLLHLALSADSSDLPTHMALLTKLLPQVTTLAISGNRFNTADLFPENRIFANLRHISLDPGNGDLSSLLDHGQWDIKSLHLMNWDIEEDEEVVSRLIRIAKGEDPNNRIERIVVYGSKAGVQAEYPDYDSGVFEWREDGSRPSFEDFGGR